MGPRTGKGKKNTPYMNSMSPQLVGCADLSSPMMRKPTLSTT